MNLDQLPIKPADIVRDRKTNSDYVVESIAGFSFATGLFVSAVGLLNDRVISWTAYSPDDLLSSHFLLRKGDSIVTASEVREKFRNRLNDAIKNSKDILTELENDENLGLRDLLMYGVSAEVDEENFLNTGILNIAETIVNATDAVPDERTLVKLLQKNAPKSLTLEGIQSFASNIVNYARSKSKSGNFLFSEDTLQELLFNTDGSFGGAVSALLPGMGRRFSQKKNDPRFSTIKGIILGRNSLTSESIAELFGNYPVASDPLSRITILARRMFETKTGSLPSSPELRDLTSPEVAKSVLKLLRGKLKKDSPDFDKANAILDAISNWILNSKETGKWINQTSGFGVYGPRMKAMYQRTLRNFSERAKEDFNELAWRNQYTRKTSYSPSYRKLLSYKLLDLAKINRDIKHTRTSSFAVSTDALFSSMLAKARIKIGNIEGTIDEQQVREALVKYSGREGSPDPYLILSSKELSTIENLAKTSDTNPVDLTEILEAQLHRRASVTQKDQETLGRTLFNLTDETGSEAVVPLKAKNSRSKVAFFVDDNNGGRFVTDLVKAQDYLDKGYDVSAYDFGGHRDGSRFYRDITSVGELIRSSNQSQFSKISNFAQNRALNGDAGTILKILREHNNKVVSTQFNLGSLDSMSEITGSFDEGYNTTKLALATVRKSRKTIISSQMDTPIKGQLERSLEYFKGNGFVLDIETELAEDGSSTLTEVAFGDVNGIIASYGKSDFTSVEHKAKSLISIASKIEEQITRNGKTVIGTAGPHDFNTLIAEAEKLLSNTTLSKSSQEAMLKDLESSLSTFKKVRQEHLFDVQTIYPFVDEITPGVVRQSWVTNKILGSGRKQIHTAVQDVKDLIEILRKVGTKAEAAIKETLNSGFDEFGNLFYLSQQSMGVGSSPVGVKRLLGVTEFTNSETGNKFFGLKYELFDAIEQSDGSHKLVSRNVLGESIFSSVGEISAALQTRGHLFTEPQINMPIDSSGKTLGQLSKDIAVDAAQRQIRSFSPIALTYWDPDFSFETIPDRRMGMFASTDIQARERATITFPQVMQRYQQEIEKLKFSTPMDRELKIVGVMDRVESFVDEILANNYPEMQKGNFDYDRTSLHIRDMIRAGSDTETMNEYFSSPAGREIARLAAVNNAAGGHSDDRYRFILRSQFIEASVHDKFNKSINTAKNVNEVLTSVKPLLSLKLGDNAVSVNFNNASDLEADRLLNHLRTLSSEEILSSMKAGQPTEALQKTLTNMSMSFEDFSDVMKKYQEAHGLSSIEDDLEKWKRTISSVLFQEDSDVNRSVRAIVNNIVDNNEQDVIFNSVNQKVERLESLIGRLDGSGLDLDSLQSKLIYARRVRDAVSQTISKKEIPNMPMGDVSPRVVSRASQVLIDFAEKSPDEFREFLSDQAFLAPKLSSLSEDEVTTVSAQADELQEWLTEKLQNDREGTSMDAVIEHVSTGARLAERDELGNNSLAYNFREKLREVRELHEAGMSFRQIIERPIDGIKKQAEQMNSMPPGPQNLDIKTPSTLITESGTLQSPSKIFSKVQVPLLALGGLVGFLAAKEPNTGDPFSQGFASKNAEGKFTGDENAISRFSEVPGDPDNQQIWYGTTSPFQLDITFKGFVNDKIQHERLQREVYNILESNMEIRKKTGEVEDRRNRYHKVAAIEALRGQI